MIARVAKNALRARNLCGVFVATDDARIAKAAEEAGARAVMTSPECATGTDRVAEAARAVEADVYINLQGDEPALNPVNIERLAAVFEGEPSLRMATLARPSLSETELWSPDAVKVVLGSGGDALYFSRSPIPYYRDQWRGKTVGEPAPEGKVRPLVHIGIYAFSKEALFGFSSLPAGRLEEAEQLEQLRALEAGWKIRVVEALGPFCGGVDRPEDVPAVEAALLKGF